MSPAAVGSARLARLAALVERDRQALVAHAQVATTLRAEWASRSADPAQRAWAAMTLHAWYTALETLVERICRQLDGDLPSGPDSHKALLEQALAPVAGLRPELVPPEARAELHDLLSFRHFFRNAYAVELDPGRLEENLERLLTAHAAVGRHLDQLVRFFEAAARAAATAP